jgi:flagellum-specific ATP synthase
MMNDFIPELAAILPTALCGSVVRTEGLTTSVAGFPAPIGAIVEIERQANEPIEGEVIAFRDNLTLVYPFKTLEGVRRGNRVRLKRTAKLLRVGDRLLGRVVNARGQTTDQLPQPTLVDRVSIDQQPPAATQRPPIDAVLSTGIRAIDGLLTCGQGQRVGIFAGSGVGKSVTLGMMARYTSADVNVIALIGERGREVNEFLERDLGPEGLARSVVVVATSDEPALLRIRAAMAATAIAEYFRDQGKNVLLLMDSITRFAMAQREIGLAAGEPPATRGYPPSVFSLLPKLVERAGRSNLGSITAFYSVLVEGDDTNEPISDAVRGLLDGHIVLSRDIAGKGHYPAIDMLHSLSRLMPSITSREHQDAVLAIRQLMAVYREHEDLISIGAYRPGSNPEVDAAVAVRTEIDHFLQQRIEQGYSLETTENDVTELGRRCTAARCVAQPPGASSPRATTAGAM